MTTLKYTDEKHVFWYLHLTEEQQKAYDVLHQKLVASKVLVAGADDKWTLLRFLKARQYDPDKATLMYMNMAKWRVEHDVETLYKKLEYPELDAVVPYLAHFYHKVDRFGRPVYIELVGKHDCTKMMEVTTEKRLVDYHIFHWERFHKLLIPACSKLAEKKIVAATVILDLAGLGLFSFNQVTRTLLTTLAKIDQDYYPESLGIMFIINTPFIFKTIWAFVNPMLEERTRKKIDYLSTVAEVIPVENLPTIFGGKSVLHNTKLMLSPHNSFQ
ncbi:hypothetical protein CEUSTIGMA_g5754.t1 [Chlamydomonas eustigma]|uniref:CRAL-TRIO domain-containing protein n=1 Tax=Chlamydomonas eustigma TaxID=1157962 RepID=A0A250X5Z2_9CHLO|nr:hypothetical protein CEUSTIGMA_g5754.t1 [Chlamydomonas eustigma]|eukprot:GAX78312.1 hypothetical protein CEUSTIGMA_g5754.t1 [Chlamydomonas eustigma]